MAFINKWIESDPIDRSPLKLIGNVIRKLKTDFRERLGVEHYSYADGDDTKADTGRHKAGKCSVCYVGAFADFPTIDTPKGAIALNRDSGFLYYYDGTTWTTTRKQPVTEVKSPIGINFAELTIDKGLWLTIPGITTVICNSSRLVVGRYSCKIKLHTVSDSNVNSTGTVGLFMDGVLIHSQSVVITVGGATLVEVVGADTQSIQPLGNITADIRLMKNDIGAHPNWWTQLHYSDWQFSIIEV